MSIRSSIRKKLRAKREIIYRKIAKRRPYSCWRTRPSTRLTEEDERLWRLIDGAIADAFNAHPDYLSEKGRHGNAARVSLVKRVVGVVRASRERGADRVTTPAAEK